MDFTLDEQLRDVEDLARRVFTERATTDRVREIEQTDARTDDALWTVLCETGLIGVAFPEEHGGAGLGLAAMVVLLEQQGRQVAPVPLWAHLAGAWALLASGPGGHRELIAGAVEGSHRLTLAVEEYGVGPVERPACAAALREDGRWSLSGVKAAVPTPATAGHVIVSAAAPDGPALFLLPAAATGVAWNEQITTTHDAAGELTLDGAIAERIGGSDAVEGIVRVARVAIAALQLGVADAAMAIAADYLSTREQFGRPLGSFQAVQHQLADCWIDVDAMRVTLWQAVQDLDDGVLADRSVQVASWWRAQAGLDVVHRVQHVHGGIGVDIDYPVHRYFLWGRQLAGTLGGPEAMLAALGDQLASTEVAS